MYKTILASIMILVASGSLHAQQDSTRVAIELGDVLGSEEFCGLQYNQDAIKRFIDSYVSKNDMGFTGNLGTMTRSSQRQNENMSGSAKTAHCAQIERVARAYGFIQ